MEKNLNSQIDRSFIALDQMDEHKIHSFLIKSPYKIKHVKIGLEVFLKYGPSLIKKIHDDYQTEIFLDLKLHLLDLDKYKHFQSFQIH